MKRYKGKPESLKRLGIIFMCSLLVAIVVILFVPNIILKVVFGLVALIFLIETYKGMVIAITTDQEKVRVFYPLNYRTIRFEDVAFCAVHGLDENKILLYAFVRRQFFGKERVKGIKSKKSFEEVVRILSTDDGNTDLDINFNMSSKIPLSFVDNSEELKDFILLTVDQYHKKSGRI